MKMLLRQPCSLLHCLLHICIGTALLEAEVIGLEYLYGRSWLSREPGLLLQTLALEV